MKKLRVFNNGSTTILRAFNLATAAPLAPLDGEPQIEEWLELAPYGESIYRHTNPDGSVASFRQCFTREGAERMVKTFNHWTSQLGRFFRGAPVYVGHPDADPARWPDSTRIGAVKKVEARETSAFVLVAWNAKGMENRREGYHVYPSPGWDCEVQGDRIVPDVLFSVGMVNTPNIHNVKPWTNSAPAPVPQISFPSNPAMLRRLVSHRINQKQANQ